MHITVELSGRGQLPSSNSANLRGDVNIQEGVVPMRAPSHQPTELPPYRAVLVVDVKDFSGRKTRDHEEITRQIPIILENAFTRCGHGCLWDSGFGGSTGDGYFRILEPSCLPYLLNPFLMALQDELDDQNSMQPPQHGNLRMRVVLAVGPITDSGEAVLGDGNGATRIEAHRMLDSEPVRDILARSSDATRVAAIVSPRVFEDAVISGYAAEDPSLYVPVDVEVKTFAGSAYLRVPTPSGDLLREGIKSSVGMAGGTREEEPLETRSESDPDGMMAEVMGIGNMYGNVGQFASGSGPAHFHAAGETSGRSRNAAARAKRQRDEVDDVD
ncbi:hypothetical protein [Saccharopolyspora griseoalba]|uniref:Guanylate cyclase domain-containing protein n=1 Tax=Saccharopolyspora griseoalba TaxID=1431848 RepID=A0ABW2LNH0_9PSEU